MRSPLSSRRRALRTVGVGMFATWAWPMLAKDVWITGVTRTRNSEFVTEVVANLPEDSQRAALPRMVQLTWTFDEASPPDAAELRRVQDRLLAEVQTHAKSPHQFRLVATGRAKQGIFWCFYVPENFKFSDVSESLAGFDAPDPAMALRLRIRLSWTQRRDPRWTWVEAYLREIARK